MNAYDEAQTVEPGLTWGDVTDEDRAEFDEVFGPKDAPPDMPELGIEHTFYGVPVAGLGEDGDDWLLALGHPDPRRVVAALNRYSRTVLGFSNLLDDPAADLGDLAGQLDYTWAVQVFACDEHRDLSGAAGDDPCPQCWAIRESAWYVEWNRDPAKPGAFPVVVYVL